VRKVRDRLKTLFQRVDEMNTNPYNEGTRALVLTRFGRRMSTMMMGSSPKMSPQWRVVGLKRPVETARPELVGDNKSMGRQTSAFFNAVLRGCLEVHESDLRCQVEG
jgi:hypothetical protein